MRKFFSLLFIFFMCITTMHAQKLMKQKDKSFNYGIKVGLNSLQPDVRSIELKGTEIDNIRAINNVGYSLELLGRININRFYLQPSVCWKFAQGDIKFDIIYPPLVGTYAPRIVENTLTLEIKSLEVPVMIGYNLIKESPYILSVMAGPKLKYNYDINYPSLWYIEKNDEDYYLSLHSAVEVIIGRLTFDFGYEFGLSTMRSTFDYMQHSTDYRPMKVKNRLDGLSMSIGILF